MQFLLFILAFVLVFSFGWIGILFMLLMSSFTLNKSFINNYWFKMAICLDQLGNVVMSGFFNVIMITKEGYLFGNEDETISSVLGKNKLKGTLKRSGKILDGILNKIDKNHSIKSIEEDENN